MSRTLSRITALAVVTALAACGAQQPTFNGADITGAGLGGELSLTDHTGRLRTLADFEGKAIVVFFGYTHCPDVCPTTLAEMKEVKADLGRDGDRLQVLFVTIDPQRDTPALLAKYVPAFDPGFLGLYGDAAATARAAAAFSIYFEKVPGPSPETYSMDHTAARYVFDPRGRLRLLAKPDESPAALAHDIGLLLAGR